MSSSSLHDNNKCCKIAEEAHVHTASCATVNRTGSGKQQTIDCSLNLFNEPYSNTAKGRLHARILEKERKKRKNLYSNEVHLVLQCVRMLIVK